MKVNEEMTIPGAILLSLFGVYMIATWILTGSPYGFAIWPLCDVLGVESLSVCN